MYEETQVLDSLKVQPYYNSLAYDIFIDEGIDSPAYYRSVISTLNKANENDHVNFIINSGGGLVSTASAIIHAMDRCKAKITAHLVGDCCSAATMISLHADEWEVSDNVTYMIHNCSFGVANSAEKVKDHHDFIQDSNRATMYREYKGLLTDEEIEKCLAGKEWWFNKEQLEERLRNFVAYRSQQHSSAMEEMFTLQNEQSEKYEEILINRLLETGEITQAEADIARKVQAATISLDEKEGDSLFETMNNPCIADNCCVHEESGSENLILSDVKGTQWRVSFTLDKDDNIGDIYINTANMDYYTINKRDLSDMSIDNLKALADDWEIPYVHNIGVEKLSDKIISYFELEIIEFLSQ